MATLPPSTDYTAATNQAGKKAFMTAARAFLADLLGTNSLDKAAARAALGAAASAGPSFSGTLTHSGDIVLSGSGKRISGDFSNATVADRVMFRTTTTNGGTIVSAVPNGTSLSSSFNAENSSSDMANGCVGAFGITTTDVRIQSVSRGAASPIPMTFYTGGAERLRIDTSGNVLVTSAASLGYGTGAGGTVAQATSKSTAVTLNKPTGRITTFNDSLAAGGLSAFQFNNNLLSATDSVVLTFQDGNGYKYSVWAYAIAGGNCQIALKNITAGALAEAITFNFAILKGATA